MNKRTMFDDFIIIDNQSSLLKTIILFGKRHSWLSLSNNDRLCADELKAGLDQFIHDNEININNFKIKLDENNKLLETLRRGSEKLDLRYGFQKAFNPYGVLAINYNKLNNGEIYCLIIDSLDKYLNSNNNL